MDAGKFIDTIRLACPLSEAEIIGGSLHPDDAAIMHEHRFLVSGKYVWYWAIGCYYQPKRILEIGVRFGYSLRAMCAGAGGGQSVIGYDSEKDKPGSSQWAARQLRDLSPDITIVKADTRTIDEIRIPWMADLSHVDGDHTSEGCYRDCVLAYTATRPGGVMLIDDVKGASEKLGADQFCKMFGVVPEYLDTYSGLYIVRKPDQKMVEEFPKQT